MPVKNVDNIKKRKKDQTPPEDIHASYADEKGLHFDSEGEETQPPEYERGGLEKTMRYSVHKPVQPGGTAHPRKETKKHPPEDF